MDREAWCAAVHGVVKPEASAAVAPLLEGLQEDGAVGVVREPEGTSEKAVASWCGC